MKNGNNGHFPPGVRPPGIPPGGKVLELTGAARDQVQEELVKRLQPHLNELNQENAAHQSAIGLVFAAAIERHGVPAFFEGPDSNGQTLFDLSMQLAHRLATQNLRTTHEKAFELFLEEKVRPDHIKPHIIRAAKRQGVSFESAADAFAAKQLTGSAPDYKCEFCGANGRLVSSPGDARHVVETDHAEDCKGLAALKLAPDSADVGTGTTEA